VNDSPALKKVREFVHRSMSSILNIIQADLGISMNMSASDVSKEAANMILLGTTFLQIS
jgi:hypothetical protein